jgi:hypothetical protein
LRGLESDVVSSEDYLLSGMGFSEC